jgi:HAD superfamily hydrolase (TIGR01509 family)
MGETLDRLGLTTLLDVIITSQDVGVGKPDPQIFLEGLKRAGVLPEETLYVGDQYQVDVVGARNAGIRGILLDRTDHYQEITDCTRIRTLSEISNFL